MSQNASEQIEIYKKLCFARLDLMVEKFKDDLAIKLRRENEEIKKLKKEIRVLKKKINMKPETRVKAKIVGGKK